MSVQSTVQNRYAEGANEVQPDLCCPVDYDQSLLKILPSEIVDKDYGCGDPSRYVKKGDTVLDLGSGGGKICYMAAQLVGSTGHVIGIDMTADMLALARKYQAEMAQKLEGDRVTFHRGYIQDLAVNLDALDQYIVENPVKTLSDFEALESWKANQRKSTPLIEDNSIDLVISNCVLNLVAEDQKQAMIREILRVLKPGGRVAISDIVSDDQISQDLKDDPKLWSGCISGAFHEKGFLDAFTDNGFIAVGYDKWDAEPWQVIKGIEFRSVTLVGVKGEGSESVDRGHAAIYRGPYALVSDEEGNIYPRGERIAVCERTFNALTSGPYKDDFIGITPAVLKDPVQFSATPGTVRPSQETKGGVHNQPKDQPSGGCC